MKIIYSLSNYDLNNNYYDFGHGAKEIDKGCIILWIYSLLEGYNESKVDILNHKTTHYQEFTDSFDSRRVLYYGRINNCTKEASLMTANKCRSMSHSTIKICEKRKSIAVEEIKKRHGIIAIKEFN